MKKLLISALAALAICASSINLRSETFFQLPIVPDTMAFNNRVNYLVTHYWDFCDLKKAFSAKQRMANAFKEYLDLMPLADGTTALNSISSFLQKLEKRPDDLLFITQQAEEYMYSDTATVISDNLYLQFAQAVARNKKIDKAAKMRYDRQARLISSCMVGATAPDFKYIDRSGEQRDFSADTATVVLLYIYDTECSDCNLARVRLDADPSTTKIIDAGRLKIVAISATTPDGEWRDIVASYPASWTVGALEDFDDIYEVNGTPSFYIMDNTHRIYAKNLSLDQVLEVNYRLAINTPDPYAKRRNAAAAAGTGTAAE